MSLALVKPENTNSGLVVIAEVGTSLRFYFVFISSCRRTALWSSVQMLEEDR